MTEAQFHQLTGVRPQTFSNLQASTRPPLARIVHQLAAAFNIPRDEAFALAGYREFSDHGDTADTQDRDDDSRDLVEPGADLAALVDADPNFTDEQKALLKEMICAFRTDRLTDQQARLLDQMTCAFHAKGAD